MKSIVKKDKKKIFEIYEMFKKDSNSIDKLNLEELEIINQLCKEEIKIKNRKLKEKLEKIESDRKLIEKYINKL